MICRTKEGVGGKVWTETAALVYAETFRFVQTFELRTFQISFTLYPTFVLLSARLVTGCFRVPSVDLKLLHSGDGDGGSPSHRGQDRPGLEKPRRLRESGDSTGEVRQMGHRGKGREKRVQCDCLIYLNCAWNVRVIAKFRHVIRVTRLFTCINASDNLSQSTSKDFLFRNTCNIVQSKPDIRDLKRLTYFVPYWRYPLLSILILSEKVDNFIV